MGMVDGGALRPFIEIGCGLAVVSIQGEVGSRHGIEKQDDDIRSVSLGLGMLQRTAPGAGVEQRDSRDGCGQFEEITPVEGGFHEVRG